MLTISICRTRKECKIFERLPERLHGDHPAFVPPFPGSVVKMLSSDSPFHRRHGEIVPLLAWRGRGPVGRIAAIVNRTHNERYQDRTGFFGFFETVDDPAVARELFSRAAEILRGRGLTCLRGPFNPSINDECGLLVDGFEFPPCLGLTWNPASYRRLIEGEGFHTVSRSMGFHLPLAQLEHPPRLVRLMERVRKRKRLSIREIDMQRLEKELEIVREVYNASLERNTGFVPISMDDLLGAADDMRAFADPGMILFAQVDGETAGVALSLPDFNEILARIRRTPHWLRLPHIFWLMKTHRIDCGRQVVFGIAPRFRDKGLHPWLLWEQFDRAKARYSRAVLGWIEDNNTEILENATMLGAVPRQEWRIYERAV